MHFCINANGIEGLAKKLGSLGDQAAAAVNEMLTAGSDYAIQELKEAVPKKTGRGYPPGGMKKSIGLKNGIKAGSDGGHAIITFKGKNAKGYRYGEIAAYLNYGMSNGRLPASHWFDNACDKIKPEAEAIMRQKLEEHLNKVR